MAEPEERRKLSTEEALLSKVFDLLLVVHEQWRSVLRTKRFTAFLVSIIFIITLALEWQVQRRNEDIDSLKDTSTELSENVKVLRDFVDELQNTPPDDSQSKAVAEGLHKIDLICQELACEDGTP